MIRAFIWLALSLGIRLGSNLLVLLLIARAVRPDEFGVIAFGIAIGGAIGYLTDMGGATLLLRRAHLAAASDGRELGRVLSVKFTVVTAVGLIGCIVLFLEGASSDVRHFAIALTSAVVISVPELYYAMLRARGDNVSEVRVALIASGASTALLLAIIAFWQSVDVIIWSLLGSRCLSVILAHIATRRALGQKIPLALNGPVAFARNIQRSAHWAVSANLAYLNGQLDALLVGPLLGVQANGIYQSVARFANVANQVPALIANAAIPRLVRRRSNALSLQRGEATMALVLITVGLINALGLGFLGPVFTGLLLPAGYQAGLELWTPLAVLAFVRALAGIPNNMFIVRDQHQVRTSVEILTLISNLILLFVYVPQYGLVSVPYALTGGCVITILVSFLILVVESVMSTGRLHNIINGLQSAWWVKARWRRAMLVFAGADIQPDAIIRQGCFIGSNTLTIASNVYISVGVFLDGSAPITIADHVRIGPYTKILTGSHPVRSSVIRRRAGENLNLPVSIGRGSWIGMSVSILPGVQIAEGCVIAAGTVLTKSTQPNGLYAGNPGVRKRDLSTEEDLEIPLDHG